MTDSNTRAEFEAWEQSRVGNITRHQGGLYANSTMQGRWTVWQAARRSALLEAAMVCENIADEYDRREGGKWPELKSDAKTGASNCENALRALADGGRKE